MAYIYCPYCGAKNDENNKFCENCGQPLASEPQAPAQPVQPYQQPGYQQPVGTYQPTQYSAAPRYPPQQRTVSASGSFDAMRTYEYRRKKARQRTTIAAIIIILFFFGIPFIFFLIFALIPFWAF
ncbi:MAG: zinc-ribbon domain-containing protein [Candidatus Heimdallarchaeaceae archaeon]